MQSIDHFISDIGEARTIREIFDALSLQIGQLGFEWFTYEMLVPPEGPHEIFFHTTYPLGFVEPYIKQRYARDDIVLTNALRQVRPVLWSEINRHPHLTAPQCNVINVAADTGLKAGAIVPIHGPGPVKASLAVANNLLDEHFTVLFTAYRHQLHLLATYAHERLLQLGVGSQAPSLWLSPRELEVLTWAALGMRNWEISEKLGISAHTVRDHLDHAKSKLGAKDKTHAASIAISHGLIRP